MKVLGGTLPFSAANQEDPAVSKLLNSINSYFSGLDRNGIDYLL